MLFPEIFLELVRQGRHNLEDVPYDSIIREAEDGCIRVLVDCHDDLRVDHSHPMLDSAGYSTRDIESR